MDPHAQQEIREFATIAGDEIVAKLFPQAWEAFVDYRLHALTLSRLDIGVMQRIMQNVAKGIAVTEELFTQCQDVSWAGLKKCRERQECWEKLQQLGVVPLTS